MAEKLYPPIIPGTLPAFYTDGTVTKITVPFSMNKAVNTGDISGFSLKIKTAYSNTYITTLENINNFNLTSNEVIFYWNNSDESLSKIKPGQFLKAQLAYINIKKIDNKDVKTIGYYSTVGVIKYTDKPTLAINEFEFENNSNEDDSNKIRAFCSTCTGVYTPGTNDISERPYQYQFLLYDDNNILIEDSGWLLYNNEQDTENNYTFKSKIMVSRIYTIQYNVKTINNLNESIVYYCTLMEENFDNNVLILNVENMYEDGYINLSFLKKEDSLPLENVSYIIDIYREEEYKVNSQCLIHRVEFKNAFEDDILNWNFQDFTVEQGIFYCYSFKYYLDGYYSKTFGDKNEEPVEIMADFEDMFLYDGQKQIKLRFNPKISSFKINHLEQKTDVIGNRYPIFFRNNIVEYKEFPISGLISYHLDDNELFIQDSLQELGIQIKDSFERQNNPAGDFNYPTKSLNLTSNNIRAERLFKMKLLDWLGNGEIKLFKSPAEGNYLVRLMNISLSPEDKLNRMLHTFSCTAYEVKEFNFENLNKLGFININQSLQNKITGIGQREVISGPNVNNIPDFSSESRSLFYICKKRNKEIFIEIEKNKSEEYYNKMIEDIIKNNNQKDIIYEITYSDDLFTTYYKYLTSDFLNGIETKIIASLDSNSFKHDNIYYFEIKNEDSENKPVFLNEQNPFYTEGEQLVFQAEGESISYTLKRENIFELGAGVYIEYFVKEE